MGYLSSIYGQLDIEPPLTWAEMRDFGDLTVGVIKVHTKREVRDTDEGTLHVETGIAVVPAYEDQIKAYSLEEDVAVVVKKIAALGGHALTGEFVISGEGQGDVWRLIARDGQVVRENARLVWPDGSEAKEYV